MIARVDFVVIVDVTMVGGVGAGVNWLFISIVTEFGNLLSNK